MSIFETPSEGENNASGDAGPLIAFKSQLGQKRKWLALNGMSVSCQQPT
jgi:hypothetical protein